MKVHLSLCPEAASSISKAFGEKSLRVLVCLGSANNSASCYPYCSPAVLISGLSLHPLGLSRLPSQLDPLHMDPEYSLPACAMILFLYALTSPGKGSTLPLSQTHRLVHTFCNMVTS